MISERLKSQINALSKVPNGILSDVEGYRQTVESPKSLVPDPENANIHTDENLASIGNSLNKFGFRKNAIAVQEGSRIIYAGNGIVQWCIENDVPVCPVVWIPKEMSEADAKAFSLADNQSGKLAEWDFGQIEATLESIKGEHTPEELGFDPDELQEAFDEISHVDEAVGNMRNTPIKKEKAEGSGGLVKILLLPTEIGTVEKALRAAQQPSRGEALTEICKQFLEQHDGEK